jgi:hypothetical protein
MAETKAISFDLREVAVALIKAHGIHEGRWMLGFEFAFGAGNFGTGPGETRPGAFMQIIKMSLTRPEEGVSELPFIVDAAKVNPIEGAGKPSAGKRTGV